MTYSAVDNHFVISNLADEKIKLQEKTDSSSLIIESVTSNNKGDFYLLK